MLESVADRVLQHCKADSRSPLSASTMCVAIEEALPACDVQRRAVAEAARSSEHATLFLLTDAEVAEFAAHVESAKQLALSPEAAHAFAVALDYLLVRSLPTTRRHPACARVRRDVRFDSRSLTPPVLHRPPPPAPPPPPPPPCAPTARCAPDSG